MLTIGERNIEKADVEVEKIVKDAGIKELTTPRTQVTGILSRYYATAIYPCCSVSS
ncbi:MAG: hypothetical protein F6K17_25930 [Okeania sp. SIO3C4]|nr:hypothetical protein [Okeania sp. SIO3C4]